MNDPVLAESLTVHAGDLPVTVHADPDAIAHQRHYLPAYLPGRAGDRTVPGIELTILHGAAAHALLDTAHRITAHPARRIEHIPGVILRESTADGRRWYTVERDTVEDRPEAFAVLADGPRIVLAERTPSRPGYARPLRLIREAMLRTYEDHAHGIVMHAAGADLSGLGVLVCGPRNAGKTTLLTELCGAGAALLSNDRVILTPDHDRATHTGASGGDRVGMTAVPLPVPLARGTLDATPRLLHALPALARRPPARLPAVFGTPIKAAFSPAEYTAALGTTMRASARLGAVLVPALDDTATAPAARALTPREAETALTQACFTPHDEFWIRPWLIPRTIPDAVLARDAAALLARITSLVPVLQVRSGVHGDRARLAALLHTTLEACR